jgi:hypothetical protein
MRSLIISTFTTLLALQYGCADSLKSFPHTFIGKDATTVRGAAESCAVATSPHKQEWYDNLLV